MGNSVPGGRFIGRAASREEEEPRAAATEPKPAMTQTPGDYYFVRTLENLIRPQAATAATEPGASELTRSESFMELYSCKSSGSTKQESRVLPLPTSCTGGVNAYNMENKRNRRSDNPRQLPYELIKRITNNFSEELGRGAFGQVFKGVLENGEEVAVKMLRLMGNTNDQQFENEFEILKRLEHPNIVRLVAFCYEAKEEVLEHNGKPTVCERIHRALCLEYMPNGSLGKLLSGENLGNNWPIRYKIIKGICEGLRYLHEGLKLPIYHFDLKPDNILLGERMIPKISDFGLSRLIGEETTKNTLTPLGTLGYLPPEFINYQVISKEYDIYSLGVIVTKIITGTAGYSDVADMGAQEFVEHVHENWKQRLKEIPNNASLEVDCKQVKRCIEIARRCMENDRHKRPKIDDIVSQLDEFDMENFILHVSGLMEQQPPGRCTAAHTVLSAGARRLRLELWSHMDPPSSEGVTRLSHKDPPSEISHSTHPEHKLKLMTEAGAPFLCDGCKEPGYGPRYACDCGGGGHTIDLHTRCALAGDRLFDLHTLVHPLFGYGKQFEFRFLHEAPSSPVQEEGRVRVCDACGEATRGFVYHCSEQGLDLHPCCASLPDRFVHDGCAFDLHRTASRSCALCPENEGRRRWFWAYRCYLDGEEAAVDDLHVACLKETARRSWETCYRNRLDVGGGDLNVDHMLENKFGEIAGTVASFITALVFGNLIVKM